MALTQSIVESTDENEGTEFLKNQLPAELGNSEFFMSHRELEESKDKEAQNSPVGALKQLIEDRTNEIESELAELQVPVIEKIYEIVVCCSKVEQLYELCDELYNFTKSTPENEKDLAFFNSLEAKLRQIHKEFILYWKKREARKPHLQETMRNEVSKMEEATAHIDKTPKVDLYEKFAWLSNEYINQTNGVYLQLKKLKEDHNILKSNISQISDTISHFTKTLAEDANSKLNSLNKANNLLKEEKKGLEEQISSLK